MKVAVQRYQPDKYSADATAVFLPQDETAISERATALGGAWPGISSVFETKDVSGAKDSSTVVYTGAKKSPRAIFIGLGDLARVGLEQVRRGAATAAQKAAGMKLGSLAIFAPTVEGLSASAIAQAIVEGACLGIYSYDKYLTAKKNAPKLEKLTILIEDDAALSEAKRGAAEGEGVVNGVILARDLSNAPSNEIFPESLLERSRELEAFGVKVTSLDKKQIQKLGMGGIIAVNQGSVRPPVFIIMEWNGGKKGEKPIVLVGKGITFDSGGISIKPAAGMSDMKVDMGGAAAVIGAMRSVAELKLKKNVVALVPSTENMPSGSAYKPGDIITFMNGKTAEIDNTDAEGRLILADALTYADRYKPEAVIDLATLTGACVIALGHTASGLMGNNDALKGRIKSAGDRTYDRVVELPLWEEYEDLIKSDVADVKNSGGRAAGSITAGLFLQKFIGDYPWAHIDIAGTAINPKASGYVNRGGTGAGVRLLIDMIRNWDDSAN